MHGVSVANVAAAYVEVTESATGRDFAVGQPALKVGDPQILMPLTSTPESTSKTAFVIAPRCAGSSSSQSWLPGMTILNR